MPEWLCKILRALIKALLRATTCERPQSHKEATIEKGSEKPAIYSWIPLCDTETLKEKKSLQFLYVTLQCSMCNGFGKNCDSWVLDTSTIRIKLPLIPSSWLCIFKCARSSYLGLENSPVTMSVMSYQLSFVWFRIFTAYSIFWYIKSWFSVIIDCSVLLIAYRFGCSLLTVYNRCTCIL